MQRHGEFLQNAPRVVQAPLNHHLGEWGSEGDEGDKGDKEKLKKNSEVRIQESESRRSLRDAKSERGLALRGAISRGLRPATTKVDHKTRKFGGGA
ncbi:hypothetical protein, partial [Nostoc sp. S13]